MNFKEWIKDNRPSDKRNAIHVNFEFIEAMMQLAWDAQENKLDRISELVGDEAGPYLSTGELMDLIRGVLQD